MTTHDDDVPALADSRPPARRTAGGGPDRAASVGGLSPPPLPSFEELAAILAADGWQEVEYELITQHGMTLHDLARRLENREAMA